MQQCQACHHGPPQYIIRLPSPQPLHHLVDGVQHRELIVFLRASEDVRLIWVRGLEYCMHHVGVDVAGTAGLIGELYESHTTSPFNRFSTSVE